MLTRKRRIALRLVVRGHVGSKLVDDKLVFKFASGRETLHARTYLWLLKKGYIRENHYGFFHLEATDLGRVVDSL